MYLDPSNRDSQGDLFSEKSARTPDATVVPPMLPAETSPMDLLFAEYRKHKDQIHLLAELAHRESGAFQFFVSGVRMKDPRTIFSVSELFDVDQALLALDCQYWSRALGLTDVMEYLPAKRKSEWHGMIHEGYFETTEESSSSWAGKKTVRQRIMQFDEEIVRATITRMLSDRERFFAERIDGIWNALSRTHITNCPSGFSKRMIINYAFDKYFFVGSRFEDTVHDLRCVIAKFMGRDTDNCRSTRGGLQSIVRDIEHGGESGKWHIFDGGAWKIRFYKVGTAHIEVHPDLAFRLNMMLSQLYPSAIPESFRRKPSKAETAREHQLRDNLLSFSVISALAMFKVSHNQLTLSLSNKNSHPEIRDMMSFLGGVEVGKGWAWDFDYDPTSVVQDVIRFGAIPDHVSHQFYSTQEVMACDVRDLAEIDDEEVLEPSAGQGGIADYLMKEKVTCVEISPIFCKVLQAKGFNTVQSDFLAWNPGRQWSRIVMNPPFSDGRAESHLRTAFSLLSNGGVLVAVLPASHRNKIFFEGVPHEYSEIRTGEFVGTNVSVVLLRLRKL